MQSSVTPVPDSLLYLAVPWLRTGMEGNNTSRTTNTTFCSCQLGAQVSSVLLLCGVHSSMTAALCQGS